MVGESLIESNFVINTHHELTYIRQRVTTGAPGVLAARQPYFRTLSTSTCDYAIKRVIVFRT